MVRFGEPDPWTKEFWRSNLRYHPKGYDPPKGIVTNAAVNLHNFDTESPYAALPGSPHSVEAIKREGVRPDFILYKPPESFNQIGIAPDRVMLRYQASEAMRRETIAMLRKKRQMVAAEYAEEEAEAAAEEERKERTAASKSLEKSKSMERSLSPSPDFDDDFDDNMSQSSATTRSVYSEPELTHNEQILKAQRDRLMMMQQKSLNNTESRVQHEKDIQRESDELKTFVDKKMLRINRLSTEKERNQKERMRISGEREREKLLRMMVMEEDERQRAAIEKSDRIRKMNESEEKRDAAAAERKQAIAEANAAKRAAAEERKMELLAECERKEQENKRQMEEKQQVAVERMEDFEAERARQLEAFRLMQEKKSQEAEARVSYITKQKEFQAQNAQARRLSEVSQRQFRKEVEKREWMKKKREEAIAKQRKAEEARDMCRIKQENREKRIQGIIDKKSLVSGKMAALKKSQLDMKLEEAHIIDSGKREKLHRLVSRKEYNEEQYLEVAQKRIAKIDEAHKFKQVLMKERRGILYTMAQAELEARDDLKLIKLRLPTTKEKEAQRNERLKQKKRASTSMF